jgi:hypothetical protein
MVMLLQETALVRIFSLKTKKGRGKRTASLPVLPSLSNFSRPVRYKNPAVKEKIHIFVKADGQEKQLPKLTSFI